MKKILFFVLALAVLLASCNSNKIEVASSLEDTVSTMVTKIDGSYSKLLNDKYEYIREIKGNENYIFAVCYDGKHTLVRYNFDAQVIDKEVEVEYDRYSELGVNDNGVYINTNGNYEIYDNDLNSIRSVKSTDYREENIGVLQSPSCLSTNLDKIAHYVETEEYNKILLYDINTKKSKTLCNLKFENKSNALASFDKLYFSKDNKKIFFKCGVYPKADAQSIGGYGYIDVQTGKATYFSKDLTDIKFFDNGLIVFDSDYDYKQDRPGKAIIYTGEQSKEVTFKDDLESDIIYISDSGEYIVTAVQAEGTNRYTIRLYDANNNKLLGKCEYDCGDVEHSDIFIQHYDKKNNSVLMVCEKNTEQEVLECSF